MRFDYYSATVAADPGEVLAFFDEREELCDVVPSRPLNGYHRGADLVRGGSVLLRAMWGGNGGGVFVLGSGQEAVGVASGLREGFPGHEVTRCDVCEDWDAPGLFDRFVPVLLEVADAHRVSVRHVGDWHRAEKGRTLYLGAGASVVQVRCYEKGRKEGPPASPGWVRLETQVRPKGSGQRRLMGEIAPPGVWGASRWSKEVAERVLGLEDVEGARMGTVYRRGDRERALYWLVRQYGGLLRDLEKESGGWVQVGEFLGELVERVEKEAATLAA